MRAFYRILTLLLLLFIGNTIVGQNPFWTFPKEFFTMTGVDDLPDNTFSSYTHAGIMDPYGEILFYKIDTEVVSVRPFTSFKYNLIDLILRHEKIRS